MAMFRFSYLDISMDDSNLVAVSHGIYQYLNIVPHLLLSQSLSLADLIVQLTTRHIVQNQNDAVFLLVHFKHVDYAGMVQPDQHFELMLGLDEEGLVNLGCEYLSRISPDDLPDCGLRSVCMVLVLRPSISLSS